MKRIYRSFEELSKPVKEAYKVLRTNIQLCGFDRKIKTIVVTSYNPEEGKTTTSINLAITMAKNGMKVLLIDADMRKPRASKPFQSKTGAGLSTYIAGNAEFEEVLVKGKFEDFDYITCGHKPPNPSELISSSSFKNFLDMVEGIYDIVIIDTPPIGTVIDCAIISAMVDGTILVIKAGQTELEQVIKAKEQLEKVGAVILGALLNKIDKHDYRSSNKYYNYYGSR